MRTRPFLLFTALMAWPLLAGCGADPRHAVERSDAVTVYSIDGNDYDQPEKRPKTAEEFHGYPVLGKVEIAETASGLELASAVEEAIGPDGASKCFEPRHGVRVVRGGGQVDYVICFQCDEVHIYEGRFGGRRPSKEVKKSLEPALNKVLTDAGVPLAPKSPSASP